MISRYRPKYLHLLLKKIHRIFQKVEIYTVLPVQFDIAFYLFLL